MSSPRLPSGIVALGLVSLFMDISSEMIHSLLPVFLVGALGASPLLLGLIEGLGEATASFAKLLSGRLSDRMGRRKPLAVLGYSLSALTKPLFALAGGPGLVLTARVVDRLGKGIRGAPRDALVADLTPAALRGAAYGLRQTLDTLGAVAGPLLAMALMVVFAGDVRLVFALAILPALAAVAILTLAVQEPASRPAPSRPGVTIRAAMGRKFWAVVALASVLTLARFSEAFLILQADAQGLGMAWTPLVLVVMNLVYAASAWPVGVLSDRIGKRGLLTLGFAVLLVSDLVLSGAGGLGMVFGGVALWGLHMGLTQGMLSALVADSAPADLRGTAFGIFNLVSGLALLAANAVAGVLWQAAGAGATFGFGATLAALGLAGLLWLGRRG